MLDRLRSTTRQAHVALEDRLALLQPPLRRERFILVLQGFLAFHRVWEPRTAAVLEHHRVLEPRSRIALIEHDLEALGAAGSSRADAPFDLAFLSGVSQAWGSLYVMEGSTLGGQFISKALRGRDWAPDAGLTYFNPYGRRTAAMWAGFQSDLGVRPP